MAIQLVTTSQRFLCLSADDKPAAPPVGSTCQETDTGLVYIYDGDAWVEDLTLFTAVKNALKE